MVNRLKYVALSALVLPGLGQLCQGRRIKGAVMIMLDNIFILAALFIALRSAGKLMVAGGGGVGAEKVLAAIRTDAPYARWVLGAFLVLWVYGVVDAALDKTTTNN
jgi:TM2 domain-containing membrane protein YozV